MDSTKFKQVARAQDVSAILLAKKFTASNALILIHSFSESDKGFVGYEKFSFLFCLNAVKHQIIGPIHVNGIDLYF